MLLLRFRNRLSESYPSPVIEQEIGIVSNLSIDETMAIIHRYELSQYACYGHSVEFYLLGCDEIPNMSKESVEFARLTDIESLALSHLKAIISEITNAE